MADNQYKIELGVNLNTTDLKSDIAKLDDKYKIKLGVDLGVDDIRKRISAYNQNSNNAKLNLKIKLDTDDLKKQINNLDLTGKSKGVAIPVNTASLESSLQKIESAIIDIKNAFGSLDSKNTKSLVVSVNQIANALEKATDESEGLIASLSALSKKDFSFNIGVTSGSSPISKNALYGDKVKEIFPQLQQQKDAIIKALQQYYSDIYAAELQAQKSGNKRKLGSKPVSNDPLSVITYATGMDISTAWTLLEKTEAPLRTAGKNKDNYKERMNEINDFINQMIKGAKAQGINLDPIINEFSMSSDELIKSANDIQTGAKETEESIERLKKAFNIGIDADGLSQALNPIEEDLSAIKKAFESLSSIGTIDGLTASFKELSDVLEKLTSNITVVKQNLDNISSVGNAAGQNNGVENLENDLRQVTITAKSSVDAVESVKAEMSGMNFKDIDDGDIDRITNDLKNVGNELKEVGAEIKKVSVRDNGDFLNVTVTGIDSLGDAVTKVRQFNKETKSVYGVGDGFSQSFEISTDKIKKETKEVNEAFKEIYNIKKQIGSLQTKAIDFIDKGDIQSFKDVSDEINRLEAKLKTLDVNEVFSSKFTEKQIADLKELDNQIEYTKKQAQNKVDFKIGLDEAKKETKEVNEAFEKLKSLAKQMGEIDLKIAKLEVNADENIDEISSLTRDLNRLEEESNHVRSGLSLTENQVKELNQIFANSVDDVRNFKKALAEKSETDELNNGLEKLKTITKEIADLKINLFKFEDVDNIKRASTQLEKLENEASELRAELQQKFNLSSFDEIDNIARRGEQALEKLKAAKREADNELAKTAKLKLADAGADGLKYQINEIKTSSEKFIGTSKELREALNRLDTAFNSLNTANEVNDTQRLADAYRELQRAIELTNSQLAKSKAEFVSTKKTQDLMFKQQSLSSEIESWLKNNTKAAKKYSNELRQLQKSLKTLDADNADKVGKRLGVIKKEAKALGLTGLSSLDSLKKKIKEYATYFSAAELFMYAEEGLRSMFEQVKLIDSAMTELKKVTDETDSSYNQFLGNAATRAKELGTTIDGLVSSTADFARLGYGFEDAQGLAEVANIYAVVGDEIEGVEGATESLISTLAAFKEQASGISDTDFAMSIVDKFNEVSNNYSISSGGIGEALKRSASSLAAANNTLDESIALTTAANEVTQNPEVVGNAMKTISMRIRGAKTEMEALGEDTDGMVESTSKLRAEILALSGVDIMENENTFKSTYAIMDELAQKWESLTDIQQASITELVAGKRQGNIMSSLMQNFDVARDSLQTSLKSAGSAMKEHEKASQSLEFKLNSLKASWQSLSQTFLDSDFLKGAIDWLSKLVDTIESVIDKFGVLGTAAGGISLYNSIKNGFAHDADGNRIGSYFKYFEDAGTHIDKARIAMSNIMSTSEKTGDKIKYLGNVGVETGKKIAKSFSGLAKDIGKDIGKALAIMSAIRAIQDIISWVSELGDETETTAKKFDRISEELSDVDSELRSLESEFSSVESQINALLAKDELTFTDEEELARLQKISSELERQIELTETLQKSLNKSLSETAIQAYDDYAKGTSFYSKDSKEDRKAKGKEKGGSIGNIVGLIAGGVVTAVGTAISGGTLTAASIAAGAGISSVIGSALGSVIGKAYSESAYIGEKTVSEVFDNMRLERIKLENAKSEAEAKYKNSGSSEDKKAYEEAEIALNDYTAALANHVTQLSEYYNSIDYSLLATEKQREDYLKMGDDLDKYNIEMGTKDAVKNALDRRFSEELITENAERLKASIQASINAGEDIHFFNIDSSQFAETIQWLSEMGISIEEVISYFNDLEKAQVEAFDYKTYDIVSNIAVLSDGVQKLTDAFAEFNEQGKVSAGTLIELNELFGNSGEVWANYVDIMTSGISSIEDARRATEELAESHIDNIFSKGGIKFAKFNEESDRYEFDSDNYTTYLSTIESLESLGIENAKEYLDARQQKAMIEEAANQMRLDAAEREALLSKKVLTETEKIRLNELKIKDTDDWISEIEGQYGIRISNRALVEKQKEYNDALELAEKYAKYETEISSKLTEFYTSADLWDKDSENQKKLKELEDKRKELENKSYDKSGLSHDVPEDWKDTSFTEKIKRGLEDWKEVFGGDNTGYDEYDDVIESIDAWNKDFEQASEDRQELFKKMVEIAKDADISLDGIDIESFDPNDISGKNNIFEQVYERVKSEIEKVDYDELADSLSAQIQAELDNMGLEIDFGRYFDKITIDGFKTKIDQINTARAEMFSTGGLSTDSIIAVEEIFDDLSSYDASKLFENTANGVRLNSKEFKRLNDEFKSTNIDNLENKLSDLGDQYIKTREDLYKLEYGTEAYNQKLRDLTNIENQIASNEELLSSYKGLFSEFQEWQNAEASGSERGMYETILEGWENVNDEISRGWVDDSTREFLELILGNKTTITKIVDGKKVKKEIDIATASASELNQAWKEMDEIIPNTAESGHKGYKISDFFTVDDDGNSTSQGVYNFLDAIGHLEEEAFGGKDVVKRKDGKIIGFDFQIVGGDEAIAKALGISEELVQIMKRAASDAGFVVTFDGSFEQLDVLKEKAEKAIKGMNEKLKKAKKSTIDIDMNVNTVEDVQSQIDKIMETFGKKDKNGKLTGAIDVSIDGHEEALQIARTLQSMKDKLTRPAYMDIELSQVEENLREPLYQLQQLRIATEQEHQIKLSGGDTSKLEESKQAIYDYFEKLDPEIKAKVGLVDADGNGLTKKSFDNMTDKQKIEIGYVDEEGNPIKDFSEAIRKKLGDGSLSIEATVNLQLEMAESLDILALTALKEQGLIKEEEYVKRVNVYLETNTDNEGAKDEVDNAVDEVVHGGGGGKFGATRETNIKVIAETFGVKDVESLKTALSGLTDEQVKVIAEAIGKGDVDALDSAVKGLDDKTVKAIANALGYSDVESLKQAVNGMQGNEVDAKVDTAGQKEKIDTLQGDIDGLQGTTVTIWAQIKKKASDLWNKVTGWFGGGDDGGSDVNGTANVNGTTGRAFKRGSWGTKNSGTALVGELGREVLVRDGRYYTIGNNGAEFIKYKKGDIIFNHVQSEQLFRNGKVTAGGGRAKAFTNGTAFANGNYPASGAAFNGYGEWIAPKTGTESQSVNEKTVKDKTKKETENKFEDTIDWIETILDRAERAIDKYEKQASNIYKTWDKRNKALENEINEVGNTISLYEQAKNKYLSEANAVGLSADYAAKVRNGSLSVEDFEGESDEKLVEKIKKYQEW